MALASEPDVEVVPRDESPELTIEVQPGHDRALSGIRSTVRALVRLHVPKEDCVEVERQPLQVVCVIDTSGSMAGSRLAFAKLGILKLVKHLDERDTLHLVAYDSEARVIFEQGVLSDEGKEHLRERIQSLKADGQTNLLGGLEKAAALLTSQPLAEIEPEAEACAGEADRVVRRVFLFSDGEVNVGVQDPCEIKRRVATWARAGVTISTFGIGQDFDEPLMQGIAEEGKGRYAYLASADSIPKLVSKAVHGLLDIYGSEAALEVRGLAHTSLRRIYAEQKDEAGSSQSPGLLPFGDIHRGSERKILVELDVAPPGNVAEGQGFEAAEWILSFQRHGSPAQFSGKLSLCATRDRQSIGEEAAAVQAAFVIQQSADLEVEVAAHLERSDRAHARDAKARQLALLRDAVGSLRGRGAEARDIATLERILVRAERVSQQLQSQALDEHVRRQSVQEEHLCRQMSEAGFASAYDSDAGFDRLRDFGSFTQVGSPTSHGRSFQSSQQDAAASARPDPRRARRCLRCFQPAAR